MYAQNNPAAELELIDQIQFQKEKQYSELSKIIKVSKYEEGTFQRPVLPETLFNIHHNSVDKVEILHKPNWMKKSYLKGGGLRIAEAIDSRIDSVFYEEYSIQKRSWSATQKVELHYNSSNEPIRQINFTRIAGIGWKPEEMAEYDYDDNGQVILMAFYYWNMERQSWEGDMRFQYAFDEHGNRVLYEYAIWDNKQWDWDLRVKEVLTYSSSSMLLSELNYTWDKELQQWLGTYKKTMKYTQADKIEKKNFFEWDGEGWLQYRGEDYTYDTQQKLLKHNVLKRNEEYARLEEVEQYIYKYQDTALSQVMVYQQETGTEGWSPFYQILLQDSTDRQVQLEFQWDQEAEQWQKKYKIYRFQDIRGYDGGEEHYLWRKSISDWAGKEKKEKVYSEKGELLREASYAEWSVDTGWIGYAQSTWQYDEKGRVIENVRQVWEEQNGDWVNYEKLQVGFDQNDFLSAYHTYNWDRQTKQWKGISREEALYRPDGQLDDFIKYKWDNNQADWSFELRQVFTYEGESLLAKVVVSLWDMTTQQWQSQLQEFFRYDEQQVLVEQEQQVWSEAAADWNNYSRLRRYTSEATVCEGDFIKEVVQEEKELSVILLVEEEGISYQWWNCDLRMRVDGATAPSFKPAQSGVYALEVKKGNCIQQSSCIQVMEQVVGVEVGSIDEKLAIYPNPIQNIFSLKGDVDILALQLYDLNGRLIKELAPNVHGKYSAGALQEGMYFLKVIKQNGQVSTLRLLIR
ncbi:hypothetical protein GCM10023331_27420 [Algivirga pacifica]|uniref:Secretion system C-terminal sorting domain-containing protein n=2 Tax=Algivirga pacifica TaxID=1162670 RepID=A0ABP9DDN4_9BACT